MDVQLGPRERAVLSALVDHAGRVVDRDQLRRDAGLDQLSPRRCEAMLVGIRRALGPDAVVTVRRRGWRLNPDVTAMALAIISTLRLSDRPVETVDLARLLLDLLVVIVAAKLAAEGAERIGVPAVLGEIVAGIVIGPSVLGLIDLDGERGVSLGMLAELGVLLLLVQVGMEMDLAELGRVGRASMAVAVIGVAVPFVAGAGAGIGLGWDTDTAIFLGAALTATSVGITARVFGDLRALATTEARIVLGAAVADDVLGLIILTVVVKVVTGDSRHGRARRLDGRSSPSPSSSAPASSASSPCPGCCTSSTASRGRARRSPSPPLALILGLAVLADAAQLAFIIGAFMAGLALGRSEHHERIAGDLNSVGGVLIPVFFVLIGVNADLGAMMKPSVLLDARSCSSSPSPASSCRRTAPPARAPTACSSASA